MAQASVRHDFDARRKWWIVNINMYIIWTRIFAILSQSCGGVIILFRFLALQMEIAIWYRIAFTLRIYYLYICGSDFSFHGRILLCTMCYRCLSAPTVLYIGQWERAYNGLRFISNRNGINTKSCIRDLRRAHIRNHFNFVANSKYFYSFHHRPDPCKSILLFWQLVSSCSLFLSGSLFGFYFYPVAAVHSLASIDHNFISNIVHVRHR